MPEGHTVHRIARDHHLWFAGQTVRVASPQGRFASEAARLDQTCLELVEAHGKHLFYQWSESRFVHVHLGLYGKFRQHRLPTPEAVGAVRLRVIGTDRAFDLNGPNRCELIDEAGKRKITERLGADPLRGDADWETAADRIHSSRAEIGRLLLDQTVIAGLGNIYRAEILHRLGIHPARPGKSLQAEQLQAIWDLSRKWLKIGMRHNRIITADPQQVGKTLSKMNAAERLTIYKKPHCLQCGAGVRSWEQAARKIYACETCQR